MGMVDEGHIRDSELKKREEDEAEENKRNDDGSGEVGRGHER